MARLTCGSRGQPETIRSKFGSSRTQNCCAAYVAVWPIASFCCHAIYVGQWRYFGLRQARRGTAPHTEANSTRSISVGSSSLARELFTRFDTGHFCNRSFGAGFNNSRPASPRSQGSKSFAGKRTGIRSCTSATKSFGSNRSFVTRCGSRAF